MCLVMNHRVWSVLTRACMNLVLRKSMIWIYDEMSCVLGVTRGIEWIRCNTMMWHDVIWEEMTCQLDTWHDADLTWIIGNGHGARIRGGDRWNLSGVTPGAKWAQRLLRQGWGKIRPIQIRIRIREYSANSNFASECTIRRIRIRILKLKFEFGRIEFESNRTRVAKFVEYSSKIRIRLCYHSYNLLSVSGSKFWWQSVFDKSVQRSPYVKKILKICPRAASIYLGRVFALSV